MNLELDELPATIRDVAIAMQGLNNCPPEMTVPVILSLMSYAVQGRYEVDTRHFGNRPLSIYTLVVAESGQLKSEIFKMLAKGGIEFERDQRAVYEALRAHHVAELTVWEDQKKDASKEKDPLIKRRLLSDLERHKPVAPKDIRCIFENPTYAGLINNLELSHHSTIIMSPEAGTFFGGHAMKSDDVRQQFFGNLNKLWNAERVERTTSMGRQDLYGRRMSMLLMTQESTIREFVNDRLVEDMGLAARFLISIPPQYSLPTHSLCDPEYKSRKATAEQCFDRFRAKLRRHLEDGLAYDEHDQLVLRPIAPDQAAFALYDAFQGQDGEGTLMRTTHKAPFFAKYLEHCLRLAGVMAAFDRQTAITAEYMTAAFSLMRYFGSQWLTVDRSANIVSKEAQVIADILAFMRGRNQQSFTATDLRHVRSYHTGLSGEEKKRLRQALVEDGHCTAQEVIKGKNRTVYYGIV